MEPEVALLIGLPGAGKSTYVAAHLGDTHAVVSKDLMGRSAPRKEERLLRELAVHLAAGMVSRALASKLATFPPKTGQAFTAALIMPGSLMSMP